MDSLKHSGVLRGLVCLAAAMALSVLIPSGCQREADPADQKYTTRAVVVALPEDRQPLMLHHEEIPEFVGKAGEVVGMKEMVMPFEQVAAGVSLADLAAGDKIELDFEVRWKQRPRTLVTRIEKLDPSTALNLAPKPNED
jgi:Cu/Ag efflux protein CusF